MSSSIRAGTRVRVRIPRNQPCSLHCLDSVPVLDAIGTVDRIDERNGAHGVVVFDLFCPTIGTQWVDSFKFDELVPVE